MRKTTHDAYKLAKKNIGFGLKIVSGLENPANHGTGGNTMVLAHTPSPGSVLSFYTQWAGVEKRLFVDLVL